ncbi:MAG: hypothetical protein R2828_00885 [Saprospiraceae bacterium]
MVKVNRLRNLLRKWRSALITDEEVRIGFEEVLEKSVAYTEEYNIYRNELRTFDWDNFKKYQKINTEAAKAIESGTRKGYKKAILLINEGKRIRKQLLLVIDTINRLNEGKQLLKSIEKSINSRWLKKMPSIILIYRYLKEAEDLMKMQNFLEANVLINSCIQDIHGAKSSQDPSISPKADLQLLIDIFRDTQKWATYCPQPQLAIEGKVDMLIIELIENGQIKFAKRLIEDLKYLSKNRIAFHKIIKAYKDSMSKEQVLKVKTALESDGWISGSNFLLEREISSIIQE